MDCVNQLDQVSALFWAIKTSGDKSIRKIIDPLFNRFQSIAKLQVPINNSVFAGGAGACWSVHVCPFIPEEEERMTLLVSL